MSEAAPSGWREDTRELQDLRQFFYQCPVGLLEIGDDGLVNKVNPAAVAMLGPAIGRDKLANLFPLLNRLAPQIVTVISQDRVKMGRLADGQRMLISAEVHGTSSLEIQAVRVSPGRVMIVLLDVSAEQRLAAERNRLYEAEHAVAHQLQRALLPEVPPELPGAAIGVRYRPAKRGQDVGGDWCDVFELSGGRIGFAVGDVVGHDLKAAVAMGRLQQMLRYVAASGARPAEVLHALDEASPAVTGAEFATLGYAEYSPADDLLTYACAGHPPPLLVADGHARYLNDARSTPLGFGSGVRTEAQLAVPPGAMLVWYSDGLIERRAEDIECGLHRLAALATDLSGTDAQRWADSLLAGMTADQVTGDDVVVACLHLRGGTQAREHPVAPHAEQRD